MLEDQQLRHKAVAKHIIESIESGHLRTSDRLPPERTLSLRLQVSRTTIRRALKALVTAGYIEARRGSGYFVAFPPLEDSWVRLMSFTELARSRGLTPSAVVLEQTVEPATLHESELFGLAPGSEIFVLQRLRCLDAVAVSVDTNRIPLKHAPSLLSVDFTSTSLYAELGARGIRPVKADYSVQAVPADAAHANFLDAGEGEPMLRAAIVSYVRDGSIIELGDHIYRGDRYRFRTTIGGSGIPTKFDSDRTSVAQE